MSDRPLGAAALYVCLPVILTACADSFVREDIITDPAPGHFSICHGGTCDSVSVVNLNQQQWQSIREIFNRNSTPRQERDNIKLAIAALEQMVGRLTDTYNDKAENDFDLVSNHYMDCVDESTNTTIYLMMLQNDGLLRWHAYQDRSTRGYFITGWPHTTAVIKEASTGERYAVDSWFRDNGWQPAIVPYQQWRNGWRPPKYESRADE